jgi:hypothetical protein
MDLEAELTAPCSAAELFGWVEDLASYPRWLEIVTKVEPRDDDAWAVDLRGRVGPLARSKRLRMVRAEFEPGRRVVFERRELDDRQHSPWQLRATVDPDGDHARLAMALHYGGGLFGPVLEHVLRDEIERSRVRLVDLVTSNGAAGDGQRR